MEFDLHKLTDPKSHENLLDLLKEASQELDNLQELVVQTARRCETARKHSGEEGHG